MRDFNRKQLAAAKSRRASSEELREARERLKEIDAELRQMELLPETKNGEEREQRYERVLRLRAMREDFERKMPPMKPHHPNGALLSLVMLIGSFMICAACAGGTISVLRFVTQKPDPAATASGFWEDMKARNYTDLHDNFLYPTLRVQQNTQVFIAQAQQADDLYGPVVDATLISAPGNPDAEQATLTYTVTRAKNVRYNVTLTLRTNAGAWGVSDFGAAIAPTQAGVPTPVGMDTTPTIDPNATPSETPSETPSDTTTGG